MRRIATGLSALVLALGLVPVQAAAAAGAGRGPGVAPAAPSVHMRPAGISPRHGFRGRLDAGGPRRLGGHHRFGRHFAGGPWWYAPDPGSRIVPQAEEPERVSSRDAFEAVPVVIGIARAPEPRPVIYRIEGTKARPVVRVLRVGPDDMHTGIRYAASAEGGHAEILSLGRR